MHVAVHFTSPGGTGNILHKKLSISLSVRHWTYREGPVRRTTFAAAVTFYNTPAFLFCALSPLLSQKTPSLTMKTFSGGVDEGVGVGLGWCWWLLGQRWVLDRGRPNNPRVQSEFWLFSGEKLSSFSKLPQFTDQCEVAQSVLIQGQTHVQIWYAPCRVTHLSTSHSISWKFCLYDLQQQMRGGRRHADWTVFSVNATRKSSLTPPERCRKTFSTSFSTHAEASPALLKCFYDYVYSLAACLRLGKKFSANSYQNHNISLP